MTDIICGLCELRAYVCHHNIPYYLTYSDFKRQKTCDATYWRFEKLIYCYFFLMRVGFSMHQTPAYQRRYIECTISQSTVSMTRVWGINCNTLFSFCLIFSLVTLPPHCLPRRPTPPSLGSTVSSRGYPVVGSFEYLLLHSKWRNLIPPDCFQLHDISYSSFFPSHC
jgi:hypothetical protein